MHKIYLVTIRKRLTQMGHRPRVSWATVVFLTLHPNLDFQSSCHFLLFTAPRHPLWLYSAGALEPYVSILRCAFCVSDENGLSHLMSALCFFPLFLPSTASPSLVSSKYRRYRREHLNVALFPFTRFVRTLSFDFGFISSACLV